MIEIVPYQRNHLYLINRGDFRYITETDMTPWEGMAATVVEGDCVLAIFGLRVVAGVGTAWALLGDSIKARPMLLHRAVKRNIPIVMASFSLAAIEARADNARGREWLARLGFKDAGECMRLMA